jgi:uncharacterized membrane protein YgcG
VVIGIIVVIVIVIVVVVVVVIIVVVIVVIVFVVSAFNECASTWTRLCRDHTHVVRALWCRFYGALGTCGRVFARGAIRSDDDGGGHGDGDGGGGGDDIGGGDIDR